MQNYAISRRNRAKTAQKYTKKCNALPKLPFSSKPIVVVVFFSLTFSLPSRRLIVKSLPVQKARHR